MNAAAMITVALDGKSRQIPNGTTLAALVAELGFTPNAVGTAVNGRFVARGLRDDVQLHCGDSILFFQAIAGG